MDELTDGLIDIDSASEAECSSNSTPMGLMQTIDTLDISNNQPKSKTIKGLPLKQYTKRCLQITAVEKEPLVI